MEMEDEESEPGNVEITIVNGDFEQRNKYFTDVCKTLFKGYGIHSTLMLSQSTMELDRPYFVVEKIWITEQSHVLQVQTVHMENYSITYVQMSIRTTSPKIGTAVRNVEIERFCTHFATADKTWEMTSQ